ncbi:hypothetical protein FKN01_03530 [Streptomyces sp. 130]|uniref:hypothetical protein n=1 Tax=Streptomyces sp. 130 TaxID=2591006 RepID=UPI00117D96AD|nr:hypothetical protein [Streptomyces sp. 130]TRV81530.1 hypothetical protein FKN01_03530 [Streptomyces sp. 130]
MPRPTAAQLSYGSVTVVFSTLVMLLLFRTSSGIGIAAVGTVALALGLVVSVSVPARPRRYAAGAAGTGRPVAAHRGAAPAARDEERAPVSARSPR